jgi:FkbM family methyltransferase
MPKFYGQFDPPVDQFIFQRYFPDSGIKGIAVECGAFDGLTECSCKFFEESSDWQCYNLEPAPANYSKLVINRPNSTNLPIGLSNESGSKTFTHVISPLVGENFGNGSLQHTAAHLEDLKNRGCQFQEVKIDVLTWRDFVEKVGLQRIDLLVLDVEGHELAVIEGMKGCSVLPDVICIEVGHLSLVDIRNALGQLGYIYDISSHVNAFFIRIDRIGLFSLRGAANKESHARKEFAEAHTALLKENNRLTKHIEELTWMNNAIKSSKAWRFGEWIRSLVK